MLKELSRRIKEDVISLRVFDLSEFNCAVKALYLSPDLLLSNVVNISHRHTHMSCSILLEGEEQELQLEQGIPVCGENLTSPVVDQASYIEEIHYRIGNKLYIENAD